MEDATLPACLPSYHNPKFLHTLISVLPDVPIRPVTKNELTQEGQNFNPLGDVR